MQAAWGGLVSTCCCFWYVKKHLLWEPDRVFLSDASMMWNSSFAWSLQYICTLVLQSCWLRFQPIVPFWFHFTVVKCLCGWYMKSHLPNSYFLLELRRYQSKAVGSSTLLCPSYVCCPWARSFAHCSFSSIWIEWWFHSKRKWVHWILVALLKLHENSKANVNVNIEFIRFSLGYRFCCMKYAIYAFRALNGKKGILRKQLLNKLKKNGWW